VEKCINFGVAEGVDGVIVETGIARCNIASVNVHASIHDFPFHVF
jgi:hypothetical protein